ncbi:MAG: hypothetical protein CBC22_03660 [Alphaproteobacteria bacterium TMED62]|nr:MAG: hypothetical protein CBC22_03660 [Alphaproteobacteria bacterium TMED62]|tara:strand:- start:4759 stop:6561 length:1803 start_codon:yes stop_codon:yes gene_type:complete
MKKNIKKFKYIYVDSLVSIKYLKTKTNLKNHTLISFNPSLVLNKNLNVLGLEQNTIPEDFVNLGKKTYQFSGKVYNSIIKYNNDPFMGIWIARYLISIQNIMYRANKINQFINNDNCLLVMLDFKDKIKNYAINGDLFSYMAQFKNCKVIELEHLPDDLNRLGRDPQTNFWIRLKFESFSSIFFRIICIIGKLLQKYWPFKKIYYSNENTLLKRIAFRCFLKGHLILKFPKKINLLDDKIIKKNTFKIFENIEKIIIQYQKEILGSAYTINTESFFLKKITQHINSYVTAYDFWNNQLNSGKKKKIYACLFGFPNTAMEVAFSSLTKKYNIVTASFQHAISKEISEDILSVDSVYESNIVDYYFVYNKATARYSKLSRFHRAKNIVLGLPEDLKKGMMYKNKKLYESPVLYASTSAYCGNRGITNRAGSSDVSKAEFELGLIDDILAKLPHKVQYKPYFSKRYSGEAIEINRAKTKENILVNLDEIDLRYLINNSRLIITSRATSTVGWCIFSSKPLIYIETIDNRLNKEATNVFKKSLFFFDVLDANWKIKLYNFLNRDISTIEKEWINKKKSSKNLIFNFLGYKKANQDYIALNKIIK